MNTKAIAATAASLLVAGALFAVAAPASADDAAPAATSTEVASSPSTDATTITSESTAPTSPKAAESADDSAAPGTESSADSDPGTASPDTSDSTPTAPTAGTTSPEGSSSSPTTGPLVQPKPWTEPETSEVYWAMPNGGTPDAVTWPQTLAAADALTCGVWYQVDTYPTSAIPALTADGILTDGEDHAVVKSWRFVYGGDCPAPANPAATIDSICGSAHVTVTNVGDNILTASVVVYVDGEFYQAFAVAAGDHQQVGIEFPEGSSEHSVAVRTGPAFGDTLLAEHDGIPADCAVVVPPTDTPTPPVDTPAPTPDTETPSTDTVALVAAAPTGQLAQTGSDTELQAYAYIALSVLLVLLGVVIWSAGVIIRRRRSHRETMRRLSAIYSGPTSK